jgi:hypothetical protein
MTNRRSRRCRTQGGPEAMRADRYGRDRRGNAKGIGGDGGTSRSNLGGYLQSCRRIFRLVIGHSCDVTSARAPNSTNPSPVRRSVRWIFLNRRTGHITVIQWPNISLSVFLVLSIALHTFRPAGGIETLARVIADVAILVWAIDELLRGVNPFRRTLGFVVMITTCVALSSQGH